MNPRLTHVKTLGFFGLKDLNAWVKEYDNALSSCSTFNSCYVEAVELL